MIKVGDKVNKLLILEKKGQGAHKDAIYKCQCDCGNIVYFKTTWLRSAKDCGCSKKNRLVGNKYGRLTVVKYTDKRDKCGNIIYKCQCDCGNIAYVSSTNLTTSGNKTVSCGCYKKEKITKHNLHKTKIYHCYISMKQRCLNSNNSKYKDYGGRGIKVCEEWKNDFMSFYNWSMENGYRDDLTIDRIDVNGNYEPSNCRWVNMERQMNNTRRNHQITYNGQTLTMAEWAKKLNMSYAKFTYRIKNFKNIDDVFNK